MTTSYRYSLDSAGRRAIDFEVSMVGADRVIAERRIGCVDDLVDVVLRRWRAEPERDGVLPTSDAEFFDLALADALADERAFWNEVGIDDDRRDTVTDAIVAAFPELADDAGVHVVVERRSTRDNGPDLWVTLPDDKPRNDLTAITVEYDDDDRTVIDIEHAPERLRIDSADHVVARRMGESVAVWLVPITTDGTPTERTCVLPPDSAPVHHNPADFTASAAWRPLDGGTVSLHPGDALPMRVGGKVIAGLPADGFLLTLDRDDSDDASVTVSCTPGTEGWLIEFDDEPWATVLTDPAWDGPNAITTIRVPGKVTASVVSIRATLATPGATLPTKRFAVS